MKTYEYTAKTKEEAIEKAIKELNIKEEEFYIKETEEAGGIFKGKKFKIEVLPLKEVVEYTKEFLKELSKLIGIEINSELKVRDKHISINMFSNNNPVLIGKYGRTIDSIQNIIKSSISNKTGFKINVFFDVEGYKEKQHDNLEYNAKKIAIDVKNTGVEAKLDPMNSYERRIVHNICNELGGVITESVGEEPNRYIIIKKED